MLRVRRNSGVALVLTLLVVAMLTVVVVSFNAVTRTEQAAARNYTRQGVGSRVATIAEGQAIRLLQGVLTNTNGPLITQPGRALYVDSGGTIQEVSLSSAALGTGSSVDLNINVSGTGDSQINWNAVSTNRTAGYFSAPWIDLLDSSGQLQGRYAFWIDDNGSRLNLNYASTNVRESPAFYPTNRRPLNAMDMVFGTNTSSSTANRAAFNNSSRGFGAAIAHSAAPTMTTNRNPATPTWGYFFLPEQIRSFAATNPANGAGSELNRSNAQRLFNALQWQMSAGPGNLTNTNSPPPLFGRQELLRAFLGTTASEAAVDDFISRYIDSASMSNRFGGQTFGQKYTRNVLRQILANINDFTLGSVGIAFGANLLDTTEGVPRTFAALRPTPHLNEVAVRPYYAVNANGSQIEVQVYLGVELINPYPAALGNQSRLYFDLERFDFTGTYERDGVTNNFSGGTNPWPRSGIFVATPIVLSNDVPGRSYSADRFFYRWEWSANTPATNPASTAVSNVNIAINFQLRTIQLSQTTNPISMRDWACSTDLPVWTFNVGSAQASTTNGFVGFGNTGPLAQLPPLVTVSDAIARGVAKNDPRVRTFPAWAGVPNVSAWLPVGGGGPSITMGSNNSVVNFQAGTGTPRNLPNDDATNNIALEHPSFLGADRSQPSSWLSAFELGQIHTGLQWRTLQLHSQNTNEATLSVVPDWAFLDVFALTNSYVPAATRINANALPFPALRQGLQAANAVAQGLARPGTYVGLVSGFTSSNSPQNARILASGSLTNAGLIDAEAASFNAAEARRVGTNLASANFTTTNNWAGRRQTLPGFPIGALGSLAEVVEIAGVSDGSGLSKAEREQRGRVLYESMSTYSDTFTIYSVGQALERLPSGQIDVLGEVRTRTQVRVEHRFDPASGQIVPRVIPVVRTPIVTPDSQ